MQPKIAHLSDSHSEPKIQSGDPDWYCDTIRDRPELRGQEAIRAAQPDVTRMDEPQKVERDEILPDLPDEIGKENQEADGGTAPQPFVEQPAGPGQNNAANDAASRNTMVYFVIMPRPTTAPSASHQRWSSDLNRRKVTQAASTHHR